MSTLIYAIQTFTATDGTSCIKGNAYTLTDEAAYIAYQRGQAQPAELQENVNASTLNQLQYDAGAKAPAGVGDDGTLYGVDGELLASRFSIIPSGWDAGWRTALASVNSGLARVSVIGDSQTYGYYASSLQTTSWFGLIRSALQAKYGDGGSGLQTTAFSTTVLNNEARNASVINAWIAAGDLIGQTGTWTEIYNGTDGPGGSVLRTVVLNSSLTFTVRGTRVDIFYQSIPNATAGTLRYSVDGGAAVDVSTFRATQGAVETITLTGLSAGNHTVVISAPDADGSTKGISVCSVSGRNSTGVVVDRCARGGQVSYVINNVPAATWTTGNGALTWGGAAQNLRGGVGGWNGGSYRNADLIMIALGANDAAQSTGSITPDTYFSNFKKYLVDVRESNPSASILLIGQLRGAPSVEAAATQYFANYMGKLEELCAAFNCGFINVFAASYNSYNWALGKGYWGNNAVVGVSGSDTVHQSDAGHAWQAGVILPIII